MDREHITGDMAQAREEVRRVTDAMTIENQKAINEVREKMLLEQAEMQARFDSELKDGRSRHENTHTDLSQKYETLQTSHQGLLDKRREMESQLKELSQQTERKEYELQMTRNELYQLRPANPGLD